MKFHNPYNFIPATGKLHDKNGSPKDEENTRFKTWTDIAQGNGEHVRHDSWQPGTWSGTIVCKVEAKSPLFIGDHRVEPKKGKEGGEKGMPAVVKGYKAYLRSNAPRSAGMPRLVDALPGNSLRGVIGSVAETISQSALRVLENKQYSYRKTTADGALSAIGMLRERDGQFEIIPLTLPTVSAKKKKFHSFRLQPNWIECFQNTWGENLKWADFLPVYVRLPADKNLEFNSYQEGDEKYYCDSTRLLDSEQEITEPLAINLRGAYSRQTEFKSILFGQGPAEPSKISKEEGENRVPGILRVLGCSGVREKIIPQTKQYEIFIPLKQANKDLKELRGPAVPPVVLERFNRLAKERESASENSDIKLPLTLKGQEDWTPKDGDLFYFAINENGQVTEISLSALWRGELASSTHDFFAENVRPLVGKRNFLTPAEMLFGVVEELPDTGEKNTLKGGKAKALASRLRFNDAFPQHDTEITRLEERTLRVLSSPKPPCPALYYRSRKTASANHHNSSSEPLHPSELNPQIHEANGRKVFLHHRPADVQNSESFLSSATGENSHNNQKVRCAPMRINSTFFFSIDFDNLSSAELALLRLSIVPSADFQHRVGMAKSLGLGSARITIEAILLIDRVSRYTPAGVCEARYSSAHWSEQIDPSHWPVSLSRESDGLRALQGEGAANLSMEEDMILVDEVGSLDLLTTLGELERVVEKVTTPFVGEFSGKMAENEFLRWFVKNQNYKKVFGQTLGQVIARSILPTLDSVHADRSQRYPQY